MMKRYREINNGCSWFHVLFEILLQFCMPMRGSIGTHCVAGMFAKPLE